MACIVLNLRASVISVRFFFFLLEDVLSPAAVLQKVIHHFCRISGGINTGYAVHKMSRRGRQYLAGTAKVSFRREKRLLL
jgi:hypothetical protein